MKKILVPLIVMSLTACASQPSQISKTYVSKIQYQDYSCSQIERELENVTNRINVLKGRLKNKADTDGAQMAIGLVLFWPALFFLEGGDGPEAQEFSQLKGEAEALQKASYEKNCTSPNPTVQAKAGSNDQSVTLTKPTVPSEQTELVGEFRPPPVGTVIDYSNMTAIITAVKSNEYDYRIVGKDVNRTLTSLFTRNRNGQLNIENRSALEDQLWPLVPGKKIFVNLSRSSWSWSLSVEVEAKEVITVPYGKLFTYRLKLFEEGLSHDHESVRTVWYAPAIGTVVKHTYKVTRGRFFGETEFSELIRMTYPSEELKAQHLNGAKPLRTINTVQKD